MTLKTEPRKSIAVVLGLTLIGLAGFMAVGGATASPVVTQASPYLRTDSVLVTPEEVAEMGATPEQVAHQQAAWDSLSAAEYEQQSRLAASEHAAFAAAYERTFTVAGGGVLGDSLGGPSIHGASVGSLFPMVHEAACTKSLYTISSTGWLGADRCFAGSVGTYNITNGYTANRLRTGAYTGRVKYAYGNQYYWSTTRPPEKLWRNFTDPNWVTAWTVQLL